MSLAPIAVFAYNRPDHLRSITDALARNPEAKGSHVFVYSDAPGTAAATESVARVRALARGLRGFAAVDVIEQRSNQGVARSVTAGVADLAARFGRVIVLEDDLLPSRHFLRYMNQALDTYAGDDRVISVHAYSYPVPRPLPDTFFLRGADCWGWATWKRGWDLFEPDGRKLLRALEQQGLLQEFDFGGAYPYSRMLRDAVEGRNDSWAIRWYASAFLHGKLTLYPGSSQVQNIGADGSGTHVGNTSRFHHAVWGADVAVGGIPVAESAEARQAFAACLARLQPSAATRLLRRFRRLLSVQGS